jgi:putative membrane-bound dehydrogenase-like protein
MQPARYPIVGFLGLLVAFSTAESGRAQEPRSALKSPLEPAEALRQIVLPPGYRAELVASEPQIVDPVAIKFDERGRLWVAEMRDYPHPPPPGEKPQSRIKLLEDRDGDGRYETAHVFADELLFANGIQPWRGGVIATVSGKILFLKDNDGDNRADQQDVWYTGFKEENPQLRVNHPRFALDNHIYAANGLRGGEAHNQRRPQEPPFSLANHDLRFDARSGSAEAISGNGQFGVAFDDYGNRFLCNNRHPLEHVVLEDWYLKRNKLLAVPAVMWDVAAADNDAHIYPLSVQWATSHLHNGQFTAACGTDFYRGDRLPQLRGNAFTCEPTGNLVHREILSPLGGTFTAHPGSERREFFATRDTWSRPVSVENGPDGALYIIDMYRAVIEHPQFMPAELKNRPDLHLGKDRGRIWRIVPAEGPQTERAPNLGSASIAELVKTLEHPNAWWRETAARLLYERQDRTAIAPLKALARSAAQPYGRVHALWALAGSSALDDDLLLAALTDSHARVREQAVKLAEARLPASPPLARAVIKLAGDRDAKVRFQTALSLGVLEDEDISEPLAAIALSGADDAWTRRAVQTSVGSRPAEVLARIWQKLVEQRSPASKSQLQLVGELATLVGARKQAAEISERLAAMTRTSTDDKLERLELSVLDGLARGLRSQRVLLDGFAQQNAKQYPALGRELEAWFTRAAEIAGQTSGDPTLRKEACELLAFAPYAIAGPVLQRLVTGEPSQALRLLAVSALASQRDPAVAAILLDALSAQTPAVRGAMLDALLSQTARTKVLLDRIAAKEIRPNELDTLRANRVLASRDPEIRARAAKLLASALPPDRAQAIAKFQASLALKADARHGKEVFRKNCSTCHRIDDVGVDVGPSIGDARTKTPPQLLVDILQPSKAIDNNFVSYSLVTTEGNSYTGLVMAETPTSITLKMPEGKTLALLRSNIEELRSNGISLMPEGLERTMTLQDMADVISFIKNWRYLSGNIPLGAAGEGVP